MAKKKQHEHAYLQSVHVKGFRTLKDTEVSFVPGLNIIIGENGVGKSNLLKVVFDYLTGNGTNYYEILLVSIQYHKITFLFKSIFNPQKKTTDNIEIGWQNHFDSYVQKNQHVIVGKEAIYKTSYEYVLSQDIEFKSIKVDYNLPTKEQYLLNPSSLEIVKIEADSSTYLFSRIDANSFLSYFIRVDLKLPKDTKQDEISLITESIEKYSLFDDKIIENLERYSPIKNVRLSSRFNILSTENEIRVNNLFLEFFVNNSWITWQFLSDGTKRLFYLIHEVSMPVSVAFIEEPELGIHPHQFHSLMLFLREQAEEKQIILTTHSPYALNVLRKTELDSIILTKLDKDKGTVFKHLSEEQKAKAIRYMTNESYLADYWMHSDLEDDEEEE